MRINRIRPDSPEAGAPGTNRRVRALVIAGAAIAVVTAGVIVWATLRAGEGPVEEVTDYVTLIAAGDRAAATELVDPSMYTGYRGANQEPSAGLSASRTIAESDLVVDEAALLATPTANITIDSVKLGDDADITVGATVEVQVDYSIPGIGSENRAYLRVERLPDTWYGFPQWQVIDPLLLPVVVTTNEIGAGPGLLGNAPIDLSGPAANGAPQHATLVYPGRYELGSASSTYLYADVTTATVLQETFQTGTDPVLGVVQTLQIRNYPTSELYDKIDALIPDYISACIAAGTNPAPNCPSALVIRAGWAQNVTLHTEPAIERIQSVQVDYVDGLPVEPTLQASSEAIRMDYTIDNGDALSKTIYVLAWVHVDGDDVQIEFRSTFLQ